MPVPPSRIRTEPIETTASADRNLQGPNNTPEIGLRPMRRQITVLAIFLVCAATAWAAPLATLTTLRQIDALSNGDGDKRYPVAVEATVTYSRAYENLLWVQDGEIAIFVGIQTNVKVLPGDRVLIRGTTAGSFRPIVVGSDLILLHHGNLPEPVAASFEQLVKGAFDCRLVKVRGVVRAADLVTSSAAPIRSGLLQLQTEAGHMQVRLDTDDVSELKSLLDATVEVRGVSAGIFDDKMQLTGTELYVPLSLKVIVLRRPTASPSSIPTLPLDKILSVFNMNDLTPRIRVQGSITYYQPGLAVVLQNGSKSLWIQTHTRELLRIGDLVNVTGFPDAHGRELILNDADIHDLDIFAPITPQPATWHQLANWSANTPNGHQNDLVSIDGTVVTEVQELTQDEYVLVSDGRLFTAIYHHSQSTGSAPSMKKIPLGAKIRVIGICTRTDTRSINTGQEIPFNILLRSFDDIEVLAKPSLLNSRNLILALSLMSLVLVVVGGWGWMLRTKVHQQTAKLATMTQFEQRRSLILEKINGSDPLDEILGEIGGLVSSTLNGVECWCEIPGEIAQEADPPLRETLDIREVRIIGHANTSLGILYARFNPQVQRSAKETEVLTGGARLASLAIETRRLYIDLRRRSEFDLLTEIPNRFAMEKFMDLRIEEARARGDLLGLIYIDLDKFKLINDQYGHHVGDLFLQAVAARMKRQLRDSDMLARLGGDEFAALVSVAHNRAEVEDIADRLVHCFDEPFVVEEHLLVGAASIGIALYPDNGTSKDSLLNAADVAMYIVKSDRKQHEKAEALQKNVKPFPAARK
jgi:diguanylate cyclase (GGDEF)-like protein